MILIENKNINEVASPDLLYHIENNIPLYENIFRMGSMKYFYVILEAKELYQKKLITTTDIAEIELLNSDIGEFGDYNGNSVPLDYPIAESEYNGRDVELNKPKRGGSGGSKFYVYVRDPKTKKVKKVNFGAKGGGGNLSVKLQDADARRAFASRHNCEQKTDKTTAGYWSCRLPRYSKQLGLKGSGRWW